MFLLQNKTKLRRDVAQAVSRWPLTAETRFRSQVSPCEICGGQSGTETVFLPSTSVFPCRYHSAFAPYSSTLTSDADAL